MLNTEKTQDERDAEYMRKLMGSQNERLAQLEAENKRKDAAIKILLQEKTQWLQSKERFGEIVQQSIAKVNSDSSAVNEEIKKLREENTMLRDKLAGYQ